MTQESINRLVPCEICHGMKPADRDCPGCAKRPHSGGIPALPSPTMSAAAPVPVLPPGSWVASRFEIVCRAPHTGIDKTYVVRDHHHHGETVLLQLIPGNDSRTERVQLAMGRAVQRCARLGLKNILVLREFVAEPFPALIADYGAGLSLARLLGGPAEPRQSSPGMPLARALGLIERLAEAIDHLHDAGAYHGDLRPESVLVLRGSGGEEVRLVDLPLGALAEDDAPYLRKMLEMHGCRAPEWLSGGELTARTDIYGLGAIAYWLLGGSPPFVGENLSEQIARAPLAVIRRIPTAANHVLGRALDRRPSERYSTAASFRRDLERTMRGLLPAEEPRDAGPRSSMPGITRMQHTFWFLLMALFIAMGSVSILVYHARLSAP